MANDIKTSDGQWSLPAGVDMKQAMKISKRDAVIRLTVAIKYGNDIREALKVALGPMGVPPLTIVHTEYATAKVYQLGTMVFVSETDSLMSFKSFDEALGFFDSFGSDHNKAVALRLREIVECMTVAA